MKLRKLLLNGALSVEGVGPEKIVKISINNKFNKNHYVTVVSKRHCCEVALSDKRTKESERRFCLARHKSEYS